MTFFHEGTNDLDVVLGLVRLAVRLNIIREAVETAFGLPRPPARQADSARPRLPVPVRDFLPSLHISEGAPESPIRKAPTRRPK